MIISEGLLCCGEEGKDVCSEQDVNNALLMKHEATDHKDCFNGKNQVEFSKGGKISSEKFYVQGLLKP